MTRLEAKIWQLTKPINGQYPRPWMTDSKAPESAGLFIVGFNQAKTFPVDAIDHASYVDALYNRNGQSIRQLYADVNGDKGPSRTSQNIAKLTKRLINCGVTEILQTNVVCYSTPMGGELSGAKHIGGAERGQEIFKTLIEEIRPRVIVAQGARTRKVLSKVLGSCLPALPCKMDHTVSVARKLRYPSNDKCVDVFLLPSLAPPAWNVWQNWAPEHFDALCGEIAPEHRVMNHN